jgi:LmbE family N-acetylglucosaminyl deacetylase
VAGGTLRILAHQDDDLLFQSRSLRADVAAGRPMTSLYLTAGDDDDEEWYWRAREAGIRAAYAAMLAVSDLWVDDVVELAGATLARATLSDMPQVRLVFVRLPDGGVEGRGGTRSGGRSLRRLWEGADEAITAVDGSATYTLEGLQKVLGALVDETRPSRILTLDHVGTFGDGDHSDHHVAAYLAERAHADARAHDGVGDGDCDGAGVGVEFAGYRGYPIANDEANLTAAEVADKEAAFFVYARSDWKTCRSTLGCSVRPEGAWLVREYEATRSDRPTS